MDGLTSQLAPQSLFPVLRWEFSEAYWLVNTFILYPYDAAYTYPKKLSWEKFM